MDIWHRVGRIVRISNIGTLIFFVLNISLLLFFFCPNGLSVESVLPIVAVYLTTALISVSPAGEWVLAVLADAQEIKRKDIKIRLIPLIEVVYSKAKQYTPSMVDSIRLKIIHDDTPNAFAIGRRTICVTDGLLNLRDDDIMAIFAHEIGHIAYRHSVIQLLIGSSNVFIAGCLLIIKIVCWMITTICGLFAIGTRSFLCGTLIAFLGTLSSILIWLWTKFCMLFLMWSMRQNEFVADEYACKIGFGNGLARVLDLHICSVPKGGLLKALYATHPHNDDRVARLQNLGVSYSRY